MSTEDEVGTEETQSSDGFTPIASQADLDRIVQARIARVEAKYSDYEELKNRVQEVEDANKSELERAIARAEAAEQQLAAASRKSLILEAASKHSVPADFIELITGDDAEAIEAAAEKIGELARAATQPEPAASESPVKFFDPGQSGASQPEADAVKEAFARQLFQV